MHSLGALVTNSHLYFSYMHSLGALVISDEMCTALGRNGRTFWGFQGEDGEPDFICCGKPIGKMKSVT